MSLAGTSNQPGRSLAVRLGRSRGLRRPVALERGYLAFSSLPVAFALLALLALPARGIAQAALHVPTYVDDCVPIDRELFLQLLEVELGAMTGGDDVRAADSTVSLACGDGVIELTLDDAVTRKTMTRRVDLSTVDASARTRLMALTVAEFVQASWVELKLVKNPELLEPVGPAPPKEIEERAAAAVAPQLPASRPPLRLGAAFELFGFSSAFQPLPGLALRLQLPLIAQLGLELSTQLGRGTLNGSVERGRETVPVDIRTTTGSLALALQYALVFGDASLVTGLGGRLGFAYLEGQPPPNAPLVGAQQFAPWGGPLARLGLGYQASPRLQLLAALEAGALVLRTRATTPSRETVAQLRGGWFGASVGVDWSL